MFDYFNSTRKANRILAGVKKAFKSEDTKTIVEYQGTSASLASEKIILRLSKLDSTVWKVCTSLVKNTGNSIKKIITSDDNFYPSAKKNKEMLERKINGN